MRDRITSTEEIALDKIEANWDNYLRTTPRAIEQFEEEYPHLCDIVNQKVRQEGVENLGTIFRPGVPDFLAFDDNGDYTFIEVKGEGDGLRHSQLKWLKDFRDVNCEIWFTDSNEGITEKMNSDKLEAYSLARPSSTNRGKAEIEESGRRGFLSIQIPETLAAMMDLEKGNSVNWSIKNRSTLELNTE